MPFICSVYGYKSLCKIFFQVRMQPFLESPLNRTYTAQGAGSFDALLGLQAKLYKLYCERRPTTLSAKIASLL